MESFLGVEYFEKSRKFKNIMGLSESEAKKEEMKRTRMGGHAAKVAREDIEKNWVSLCYQTK